MPALRIYSDGSFYFGRKPTFGWVAADRNGNVLERGHGTCDNDGSNNVAGEIAGALAALRWAVEHGFTEILIHADLSTLANHFCSDKSRENTQPRSRKFRAMSAAASRWTTEHPNVLLRFFFVRHAKELLLREAHNLSRSIHGEGMRLAA